MKIRRGQKLVDWKDTISKNTVILYAIELTKTNRFKAAIVGTQTRTRSDRKSIIKRPHTRNGRQHNVCHY